MGDGVEPYLTELLSGNGPSLALAEPSGGEIGARLARLASGRLRGTVAIEREPEDRSAARELARRVRDDLGAEVGLAAGEHWAALSAPDREVSAGAPASALDLLERYLDRRREIPRLDREVNALSTEGAPRLVPIRPAERRAARPRRLVVLASAFNPLTRTHVRMAELAEQAAHSTETLLELSKVNVDKEVFGATLAERLWMLERFVRDRPSYAVGMCSHGRFIDKARAIAAAYPDVAETIFAVGYDTLARVLEARYYRDAASELAWLFARARFLVANRGPYGARDVEALLGRPPGRSFRARVGLITLGPFHAGLSSSEVRERLRRGEAIADLVPEEIEGSIPFTGLAGE